MMNQNNRVQIESSPLENMYGVDPRKIAEAVEKKLSGKLEKYPNLICELVYVSRQKIRFLNQKFRGKNYSTDVLSFPIWESPDKIPPGMAVVGLGSIVLCPQVIEQKAKEMKTRPTKLAIWLALHSLDHLLGSHHK